MSADLTIGCGAGLMIGAVAGDGIGTFAVGLALMVVGIVANVIRAGRKDLDD
jgi:hypothetical protein